MGVLNILKLKKKYSTETLRPNEAHYQASEIRGIC